MIDIIYYEGVLATQNDSEILKAELYCLIKELKQKQINHKQIEFYCKGCGKELFNNINLECLANQTIGDLLRDTEKCDDCLLKNIRESHCTNCENNK